MNILIIKNSPVQTISFILRHIRARFPDARLHVLAHEHAAAAMAEFPEVDSVLAYRRKDIFSYHRLGPELLAQIQALGVDRVYFYLAESKKNRFDNLLYLAKRLVGWNGSVAGINNSGEEQFFDLTDTLKYFASLAGVHLAAAPLFAAFLLASPLLYLWSMARPVVEDLWSRIAKGGRS